MAEDTDKGFVVHDRRRFDAEGNLKPEDAAGAASPPEPEAPAEPSADAPGEGPSGGASPPSPPDVGAEAASYSADEAEPQTVGFSELVLSIATNALAFLGRDDPGDAGTVSGSKVNLKLAAQNIDILAMLETKTRGNLTRAESELLGSVLYDLRTLYVETAKTVGG